MNLTKMFILLLTIVSSLSLSFSWNYPLKEVSKPIWSCKFANWNTLGKDCKMMLPKLKPEDYKKYVNNLTYRRIYSVLWASSYKYWWDQWYWSHEWVDIATSLWTPVYSIWNWKVVYAWTRKWRWKVIVIRHKVKWKYFYSVYAHLYRIFVSFWQIVKWNQKIWEVWHSWNSIWNHLHFQIDLNQSISQHPRWFWNCAKWKSIMSITNNTYCLKELKEHTIDPLKFLATNWAVINTNITEKQKSIIQMSRKNMISYEEIRKQMLREFLKIHKFSFYFNNAWVYYIWKYWYFNIKLTDRKWKNYKNILPWDLKIIYDKKYFSSFYPRTLKIVSWKRKVTFLPKKTWVTFVTIKLWDIVIYQRSIRIISLNQTIEPSHWEIITIPRKIYKSDPAWWINIFQDKGYLNLINVPFLWKYVLTSENKTVVFCKVPNKIKYLNYFKCSAHNISDHINFTYKDTIAWLLVFKFFSNSWKPTKLIIKDNKWNIISKSNKLYFHNIRFTNYKSNYQKEAKEACSHWLCLNLVNRWYLTINKKLSKYDMKNLLRNVLLLFNNKISINTSVSEKFQYITRKEFVINVIKLLWLKIKNYNKITAYIDTRNQSNEFKNIINYLTKLWFRWKDRFAKYHFQPDKNITLWEALYFTLFMLKHLNINYWN